MAYLIVQYWDYLVVAAICGLLVGWWAQGTRRARPTDEGDGGP